MTQAVIDTTGIPFDKIDSDEEAIEAARKYGMEIENEDDLNAEDFRAWVEENADSLAQEDAAANGTTFEGIEEIEYETEWIDDDALFEAEYADACESEWEWMTGR